MRLCSSTVLCWDWGRERERERRGLLRMQDGKLSLCQSSNTNESVTDTVIKTLLDSSEAVQTQPAAKHILCIHMGLIKNLAGDCHYSDKWLRTENALTGKWRGAEKRGRKMTKSRT